MAVDIDSSDYEDLGEHEPDKSMFLPKANVGKRVSALVIENQDIDRRLSKKNARELPFGSSNPSTREAQHRVMVVWDVYCTTIKHEWHKRQWLGFQVIKKMASTWLETAIKEGCLSWDHVLIKLLGVLLQASCSSRSGDIARTTLYKGTECLCYKYLELKFKPGSRQAGDLDDVQKLTLKATLEYTKGNKHRVNEDPLVVFIDPMDDVKHNAVCVIKMLLVVALRLGRVKYDTIEQVLAHASERHDGVIQWTDPEAPVLSTMSGGGALRDVANFETPLRGAADPTTAVVAHHGPHAFRNGVTQDYVGPINEPVWNRRAEDSFDDRLAPTFAAKPFKGKTRFTTQEKDAYMDEHGMDKSDPYQRVYAGKHLKQASINAWRDEERNDLGYTTTAGDASFDDVETESDDDEQFPPSDLDVVQTESDDDVEVNADQLQDLCDLVDGKPDSQATDQSIDDDVSQLLSFDLPSPEGSKGQLDDTSEPNPLLLHGNQFVTHFAKINVFRLKRSFEFNNPEEVVKRVVTGNSRDFPTAFVYHCSKKCGYTTRWTNVLQVHEVACAHDPNTVDEARFACPYTSCDKAYKNQTTLDAHVYAKHKYRPKPCVLCPDKPNVIYYTKTDMDRHKRADHGDLDEPLVCPFNDVCGKQEAFTHKKAFKLHLRSKPHFKTPAEIAEYVPRKKMERSRKAKQPAAKQVIVISSDDEDDEEPRPPPKRRRLAPAKEAKKKVIYDIMDDDDE
ncbi:hypothetical protein PG985_006740 [Apiospora marii]|uniref:uncharacterized protein n=1 Tax=Apiospora marii TaxID=335849 RepID=UPI00312E0AC6